MLLKMSRNSRLCFAALAVFVVFTVLVENTDAATYTVGGSSGWRIPASAAVYETFASQNSFAVNDVLVFNFPTGQHDVAPVTTKEAYDSCNASAAISLLTIGPASVTLNSPGTHYFICTFGQHCLSGQKLAVNASASSSSPLPSPPTIPQITPSPSPLPSTAAPPPSSLPDTPSPSTIPPSSGGSASPPSLGPSPSGSTPSPSEGPSPSGSAPSPSEGPSPSDSASPPGSADVPGGSADTPGSLPSADGNVPPPPSSASKRVVASIFVGMFISAAVGFMF